MIQFRAKKYFSAALLVFAALGVVKHAEAGVALGATRVIYPSDQKQVTLGVSNNDAQSTFLIQSWIDNAAGTKENRFVITPPLFVMQGKKENSLRIIDGANQSLPKDRETLFWVNVKAIPSMKKQQESQNTLQFAIISRIKLFYRPVGLSMPPEDAPKHLRFHKEGSNLELINPTPYFLTITSLKAGAKALSNVMVPPMGNASVPMNGGSENDITYQTINDFGALTPVTKGIFQ